MTTILPQLTVHTALFLISRPDKQNIRNKQTHQKEVRCCVEPVVCVHLDPNDHHCDAVSAEKENESEKMSEKKNKQ